MGIGSAYIEGFKYATDKGYDIVIQMDADLSHNPKYLKNAFIYLKKYDFLIFSRYVSGGKCLNWSIMRKMISKFGCFYAKKILNVNINDFTGGFNIWKIEILKKIGIEKIKSNGYVFQIELKYKAFQKNFSFLELPITFEERRKGKSKISKKIVLEAVWRVWKM